MVWTEESRQAYYAEAKKTQRLRAERLERERLERLERERERELTGETVLVRISRRTLEGHLRGDCYDCCIMYDPEVIVEEPPEVIETWKV